MIEFCAWYKVQAGFITFKIPEGFQPSIDMLADSLKGQMSVKISKPKKPRTTGPHSQNNHAWGHCLQLAQETGHETYEIEYIAKVRAIKKGYPVKSTLSPFGIPCPKSQADINTVECGILIEEYHIMASECGIALREESTNN